MVNYKFPTSSPTDLSLTMYSEVNITSASLPNESYIQVCYNSESRNLTIHRTFQYVLQFCKLLYLVFFVF